MPKALKAGDTIAIISPSSTPSKEVVERGCDALRRWGYVPVVGRHAMNSWHGFAGTAEERAEDLLWALRDSTVKAIMCSRGGDGAVQVLQRIPLQEFASHPKWIIGFSDATALHSAAVSAGVMSIHGTMCEGIAARHEDDPVIVAMRQILQGRLPVYSVAHHRLDQTGEATGILVGGNMSVFCGLAGSDYDFLNRADEGLRVGEPSSGDGADSFHRRYGGRDEQGGPYAPPDRDQGCAAAAEGHRGGAFLEIQGGGMRLRDHVRHASRIPERL